MRARVRAAVAFARVIGQGPGVDRSRGAGEDAAVAGGLARVGGPAAGVGLAEGSGSGHAS